MMIWTHMGENRTTADRSLTFFEVELMLFSRCIHSRSLSRDIYARSAAKAGKAPNRIGQYFVSMDKREDWPRGPMVYRSSSIARDMFGGSRAQSLSQASLGQPISNMWAGPC